MGPFGIQHFFTLPFIFVLFLLGSVFWVSMLVECATKESKQGNTKLVWIVIILFTQLLGASIYWFLRRPERIAEQLRQLDPS